MKMNKLNRMVMAVLFTAATLTGLNAQEFKLDVSNPSGKTLILKELNRVAVEAHDGNQVLMTSENHGDHPERAQGLKPLSARGEDNTGIGLNVTTSGNEVTVFQAARRSQGKYVIKVPKGMKVQIEHTGQHEGGKIEVSGLSTELEISGRYNSVYLKNITGPALVNTIYGKIEADFASLSQKGPTSLVSVYSTVDVTLPTNTKANLLVKTPYGEAYSDLNIEFPKTEEMRKISSAIEGTLNGGGVGLELKASYGNVYLRKK
tara:strand:+ start:59843 stop:60625 length:783 start_codon:yes stop_codon:yes gene_type:complete